MKKRNIIIVVIVALACSLIGAGVGVAVTNKTLSKKGYSTSAESASLFDSSKMTPAVFNSANAPKDFVEAAERSINGVVNVRSEVQMQRRQGPRFFDPFEFFFGTPQGQSGDGQEPPMQVGFGSGVIISTDGYIITNNHVISGASRVTVSTNTNKEYEATIIGTDPETDIALLKIDAEGLQPIPFGDSESLRVGEWVLAIGNPFNLSSTVTAGIVSAKGRNTMPQGEMKIASFIQTDAAVNSGNSGGALVNTAGELVGINTMLYSQTGQFAGYSFAVPVSIASKVVSDLRQYGTVQRAMIGVVMTNITPEIAREYDLVATEGALVMDFADRSVAKAAGMEKYDVITKVHGTRVRNVGEMQEQLSKYSPGDEISFTVDRKGKTHTFNVVLKNREGTTERVEKMDFASLGATFEKVDESRAEHLRITYGVEVTSVDKHGKFAKAGIPRGFVILAVNYKPVRTVSELEAVVNEVISKAQDKVLFIKGVLPNGRIQYFAVDLS